MTTFIGLAPVFSANVAPYYNFQLTEGVFVPSKGDWAFSVDLVNDIGLIVQPAPKHSVVGFFELKYRGPGLVKQEGERFTDRYLDYVFVMRHNWDFMEQLKLKWQIDYIKENRRTGANEPWGSGLYDYTRFGGMVGAERAFDKFKIDGSIHYYSLVFPNYTDLMKEFQQGATEAETETGKQNHNILQLRSGLVYGLNKVDAGVISQVYASQRVVTGVVQPDGSYYTQDLQKDTIFSLSGSRYQKISNRLSFSPSLGIKTRASNQNYLHFATMGSTPTFHSGYYDYIDISVNLPLFFGLSKKWEFVFEPEIVQRLYSSRKPRDENNNFVEGETQKNLLYLFSFVFNKKSSDVSTTSLFYIYQQQSSNVKFEKYLPYNYTGHFVGLRYSLKY